MDRLARAGWLSHRPERLDGQLRRAAPCRPEGWYLYHGGDGQFPGQSADEQIAAHALVAARGQSPPPSSLRRLQWYAWFWLRTEILPSQRYATASGDCRLNPQTCDGPLGDGGDLVRLAIHAALAQHEALLACPS